jgi:hypothetical protein
MMSYLTLFECVLALNSSGNVIGLVVVSELLLALISPRLDLLFLILFVPFEQLIFPATCDVIHLEVVDAVCS